MAKAKATKGVAKTVAPKKTKAPKVAKSNETVLDAKTDITEVVEKVKCTDCGVKKEQTAENFSPMKKGGFRNICKKCQTKASIAWTTKRADYRKQYQRAVQLLNLGIPVVVPNAKDWQNGDVLMTIEYTNKAGEVIPSREAEVVYAEMKQAQADARAEVKAERDAQLAKLKAQRKQERLEAKALKDAAKAEAKEARAKERAEAKAKRDAERAEKAAEAKKAKEAAAIERAEARALAATEKAEAKKAEREAKALAKAEAAKQKAIQKAQEVAAKAEARKQEAEAKALAAAGA